MPKTNPLAELFAFNLLPPKTKEEIADELKRKEATAYGALLPFITLVFAIVLFLINALSLDPSVKGWENALSNIKSELNNPNSFLGQLKVTNGELVIKTGFVAEPVQKNVDFNQIFEIRNAVFTNNSTGSVATSYAREANGNFIQNATSTDKGGAAEIFNKFREQALVETETVKLRNVTFSEEGKEYRFSISFEIKPELGQKAT